MADDVEITYEMVGAVRIETGASHESCRSMLDATDGDVTAVTALWYSRNRPRRRGAELTTNGAGDASEYAPR